MRNFLSFVALLPCAWGLQAQTFTANPNQTIPDNNTIVTFDLTVSGLPATIDANFGLQTVCLDMTHTYDSDMEVQLQAPDGTTVMLFSGVGGAGQNFTNTCLEGAGTPISSANPPFTGTFKSMGTMGSANNGQNPNGVWHLLCRDMAGQDIGVLQTWSITFSNAPAQPFVFTSSNLPIIKLTTQGSPIANDPKVPVLMQIIDNGAGQRNYTNQTNYAYEGTIMAEWQGFSGPYYPKKNYDFETIDALGNEIDTSILGMTTEHDWILKAEYLDHSLLKNMVTYEMARRMGLYAPNTRPCEVVLDGQYIGYYTLTEKVKRDSNRVNIAKLTAADTAGSALTGGYIIEMNINGDPADWTSVYPPINNATCTYDVEFKHVYPKSADILLVQHDYIHNYVDSFENALQSSNYADPITGYRKYIDIGSFIDFLIVNEFSANYDSYGRSTYMYKEKDTDGGKLKSGPPWDYDRAMDYFGDTDGWVWEITHPYWPFPFWWSRFWQDDTYRKELACRWFTLRETTLSADSFMVVIDSFYNQIYEAQERNFTIWNDLGGITYDQHINALKSFIEQRLLWVDGALAPEGMGTPIFYIPADTTFCFGNTFYDAGFNGNQYNYNWQPGPDTSTITFTQPGTYYLKVTDAYGCYDRKPMTVGISQPNANFSSQIISPSDWTFTPNDQTANSYLWDFGDGNTSTQMIPTHSYVNNGNYSVSLSIVDTAGCSQTSTDTVNINFVGLAPTQMGQVSVYPNPFGAQIQVYFYQIPSTEVSIDLFNELGQNIAPQQYSGSAQPAIILPTEQLPPGVYLLRITAENKVWTWKMVKH